MRTRELLWSGWWVVLVGLLTWAAPARADALRVVLRLSEPADRALLARCRGQTSDLPVELGAVDSAPLEPSLRAQLDAARLLAASGNARVVVWARRTHDQLQLVVADVALDRVLTRALDASDGQADRSAQDEAAALVVRSALKASLAGKALGSAARELLPIEETTVSAARAPVAVAPVPVAMPDAPMATTHGVARVQGLLALGGLAGGDGASVAGHHALSLRAGWLHGRLELGARVALGRAAEVEQAVARVRLAQHRAAVYAGWSLLTHETLRLGVLGSVALHVFVARGESDDGTRFEASSTRRLRFALGAAATLTYLPRWARVGNVRAGVALRAGAEVLPQALTLGYHTRSGFVHAQRLWPVQPGGGLELVAQF